MQPRLEVRILSTDGEKHSKSFANYDPGYDYSILFFRPGLELPG
jgi:hypothetical protein